MQVRSPHALAGSGHSLYGRIVSPDRIAAGYEMRCRSPHMGPVPADLAASRMGPAQVGIRVCPLAFCPRCRRRCDRRQWAISPSEGTRQETVRLGRHPAWYEPPGTRTQNPRLKRPLLCQIELEARTARKYNIHAVQTVAFRLGSYRLPAVRQEGSGPASCTDGAGRQTPGSARPAGGCGWQVAGGTIPAFRRRPASIQRRDRYACCARSGTACDTDRSSIPPPESVPRGCPSRQSRHP